MFIKEMKIKKFRQLKDIEINFDKEINILAGGNNSGKTSVLELFNILFNKKEFSIDDINNECRKEIIDLIEEQKENPSINNYSKIQSNKIEIFITVEYLEEDNLMLIGDFFNELIEENRSIYLYVESFINIDKIENIKELELKTEYYFSDSTFENKEKIDRKKFKEKFNYKNIEAKRDVNDTNDDKTNLLSTNLHEILKDNENWNHNIEQIKENIGTVESQNLKLDSIFEDLKNTVLYTLIEDLNSTSGGNVLDLKSVLDLDDKDIINLLKKSIVLKYDHDGIQLNENSQGLGYSNLLYIIMEIYKYEKNICQEKVNILFIEEPESHMHPSMERKLIKYLDTNRGNIQKIVSSHSREVIEFINLKNIKVLKKDSNNSKIYDLNKYIKENEEDAKFIEKFIRVVSDIFYADTVIMFEGDGERLYLNHIINKIERYSILKDMYISFVQVGGRHANSYKTFLDFLELKVLIFSDLDYGEKSKLKDLYFIDGLKTTNNTVTEFIDKEKIEEISQTILEPNYGENKKIVCFTQTEEDGYARSFEDAMLYKFYKDTLGIETVLDPIPKSKWKDFNQLESHFSIQNTERENTHLLNRSMSLKGSKTDFIYDYIESGIEEVPEYINRGLEWLMKE